MAKYKIIGLPKLEFEDGGFIELDIPNEQVQEYIKRGYDVEEVNNFSDGGIFRKRRKAASNYIPMGGINPQIMQPGQDALSLPTYPSAPEAEISLPEYTPEQIATYRANKDAYEARMNRQNSYAPENLVYKDLVRPKGHFVLAEDMSKAFLKELKDNGFYANKTSQGDYEVFSNKDIADLIYTKGITPTELATKFKLGDAKELKTYFDPVYTNASMIHAKRNTEKINDLVEQGYTKEKAINQLVKEGEGTKTGLSNLYGKYTDAAYNKNQAEVEALTSMGIGDPSKLTDYQREMYLNIKNFADTDYQQNVQSAKDQVSSFGNWDIEPAESTAIRNYAGFNDPFTGEYMQGNNTTAWEQNESAKSNATTALDKYNATTAMQAQAAKEILGSDKLSDEERKRFLENPDEFNKILQEYFKYSAAPQGETTVPSFQFDPSYRVTPGQEKSEFDVTPEGATWTPGRYEKGRYIDGPVDMLYPEKYLMGPGAGLIGGGFRGLTRALEYAPLTAAPWLTGGNALNAYMGYETVKPGGLISQSIAGFKEDDPLKGWGNAGMSALSLLPFVSPTIKGVNYLNELNKAQNIGDVEGMTQAGIGNWFKGTSGGSSLIDDATLQSIKANNYQGVSDDLLTQIIQKKKAEVQKGMFSNQMSIDEELILSANKDRVAQLAESVGAAPTAVPDPAKGFIGRTYDKSKGVVTGAAGKVGTAASKPVKNWWGNIKSDASNTPWYEKISPLRVSNSSKANINSTAATTAVENTTKYQSMDEVAQGMYGSNFDDLTGLAKAQVEKAFKAQPLPSGASTSGQGAASTVTKVSDDILLKNKISQQKYGEDYDQVSSWGQMAIDKEFQAAKTLQQEASASLQAENAAKASDKDPGSWGDWVSREQNNILGGLGIGLAAGTDDENSNLMMAGLPLAFMTRGKFNMSPDKLKYLKLASSIATETSPLRTSAVLGADATNIKTFMQGTAINDGLIGTAQQTKGAFNRGVFNVVDDPNFIIKIEHPATVGGSRGMPDYENINMAEAMQNISGPTFGKVHHQVVSPTTGNRALILNKLEGAPYNELTMDDYLNMSDDGLVKFHDDLQTLKKNNLGFDFTGNNYMFDRNKNQFQLFDIDPHTAIFNPDKQFTYDFFQNNVYGGGNPLIFGSKQAGLNLQGAMQSRLSSDISRKLYEAGMSDPDVLGITRSYEDRLRKLIRGLNYEKDGGSIEIEIEESDIDKYVKGGYVVEDISVPSLNYNQGGSINRFAGGGQTPSAIWKQYTGTPWSEAKKQGLTDGTAKANLALRDRVLAGEFGEAKMSDEEVSDRHESYKNMVSNMISNGATLEELVARRIGTKEGLTNMFSELSTPVDEDLSKYSATIAPKEIPLPKVFPKQIEKVNPKLKTEDQWGRAKTNDWYGFNPDTKKWTVKDQWGRSPDDEWYNFNEVTKKFKHKGTNQTQKKAGITETKDVLNKLGLTPWNKVQFNEPVIENSNQNFEKDLLNRLTTIAKQKALLKPETINKVEPIANSQQLKGDPYKKFYDNNGKEIKPIMHKMSDFKTDNPIMEALEGVNQYIKKTVEKPFRFINDYKNEVAQINPKVKKYQNTVNTIGTDIQKIYYDLTNPNLKSSEKTAARQKYNELISKRTKYINAINSVKRSDAGWFDAAINDLPTIGKPFQKFGLSDQPSYMTYDLPKFETYSEKKEKEDETFRQKSRFEELNPDKSQYSRWKFRAAASNDDPIKVSVYGTRGERANQNIDINSKGSIMHFLDQSPETGYVHENTRNYYEQLKDDDYLGYLKSNGDNTYSVQYKPRKEFTKDNLYKNTFLVRQVKFDDIDFNTKVKDDNFAGHTYPTIKGTTQAALPISSDPDENVYDYSSGQSVVFIFKYKGKIRYQHFAGSRNEIKKEGQDIKKMYNLGDKALRIGVADAGSYSSSISGKITNDKLNSKDYGYYNRNEGTGAGMAILP